MSWSFKFALQGSFSHLDKPDAPFPPFRRDLKSDICDPTLYFGALDRSNHSKPHSLWSETKICHLLDLFGGDLLKLGLNFFRIHDFIVSNQRFSHPHHLIGRAFQTQFILTDGVFLSLAKLLLTRWFVEEFAEFPMNGAQSTA